MTSCFKSCGCGFLCRRRDEHGEQHSCSLACGVVCGWCSHGPINHQLDDDGKFCCNERLSNDNNDLCQCRHGAPVEHELKPSRDEEGKPPLATFWAVRNDVGEYYKTGTSERSPRWVKELGTARIYAKLSQARSMVTTLANRPWYPEKPIPVLVEFIVHDVKVIDQEERVAEMRAKKVHEDSAHDRWVHKLQLKNAKKNAEKALDELARLTGTPRARVHGSDCGCKSCVGM